MRIIQIVDSLEAGGTERMAVNYANTLSKKNEFSGLVVTRSEGSLLQQIDSTVPYLFLKKKRQLDLGALFRLRSFVLKNKVTHIQAHSTSFFLAFLLKIIYPSVKLIWHYHYGNNEILPKKRILAFRIAMFFFSGVIAVNQKLKIWIENNLKFTNVIYLPNFPSKEKEVLEKTVLKGIQGKRILSLANLREDKNHFLLLEVAKEMQLSHPEWTFHLIGKDFEDDYSKQIKNLILDYNLEKNVFIYGSRQDVGNILFQSDIAILTSKSEGLPVALLEYGLHKKGVVVTKVGEIPMIVQYGKNGFIVDSDKPDLFYESLSELINDQVLRLDFGNALYETVQSEYAAENILEKYLNWVSKL